MNLRVVVLCLLHTTFHGHKTMSRERNAIDVSSPYGIRRIELLYFQSNICDRMILLIRIYIYIHIYLYVRVYNLELELQREFTS